jgi:hypothetical protein
MQSKDEMIEIVKFMLEQQKKEHDSQMININITLSNQIKSNIELKATVVKLNTKIMECYNRIDHQNATISNLINENESLKSSPVPVQTIDAPVQILKVDSDDDESYTDSQQRSADDNSYDSHNYDDKYDNLGFMALLSDEIRSYPWQPGRGFLDTVAYSFECREHKRAIQDLKAAAYEGDHEMLNIVINENKYKNIDGRGMADSVCSRIRGFYDKTALTLAAQEGHLKCVKILIENRADINKLDRENLTALDYAKENSHLEVINFLNRNNAMTGKEAIALLENNNPEMKLKIN